MEYHDELKILRKTKHVHRVWYGETYPDVVNLGLDPAEHYLRYGAKMGRNPGKNFDTKFYLSQYPEAAKSGLNPLVYYWLYGKNLGHDTRPKKSQKSAVSAVSNNLFSFGFTSEPLRDLEEIALEGQNTQESAEAARELALWCMRARTSEGYREALQYIDIARWSQPSLKVARQLAIIELTCYYQMGDNGSAKRALETSLLEGNLSPDLRLAAANLEATPGRKINQINLALSHYGIPGVSLLDNEELQLYDRLTARIDSPSITDGPKISILLAAYEAQETIATALRSLQEQTWKNFEVLVLDDCSPSSGTREVTERFSQDDSRIKYVPMKVNGGAYVARNAGLDLSTGELLTIHDADDWSHPMKLEVQAKFLLSNSNVLGCTSEQARCTDRLEFTKLRGGGVFTVFNTSSFMWKVDPVKDALGYWDTVRFGADNEFIRRMRVVFGKSAFVKLPTGPLSFQREADTSITGDPVKGIDIGGYYGVRKEYLLAQEHYHQQENAVLKYSNNRKRRPFPVPSMMNEAGRSEKIPHFDLVLYGDFRTGSDDVSRCIAMIAGLSEDYTVALVEAPQYDPSNGSLVWDKEIRGLIDGNRISVLVYGDHATCTRAFWLTADAEGIQYRMAPNVEIVDGNVISISKKSGTRKSA